MKDEASAGMRIVGYSALILFFELAFIRYTAGYVRVFGFYLNFILIAAFLGMGVGLLRAGQARHVRWLVVPATLLMLGAVWYFARTPIAVPSDPDEYVWGIFGGATDRIPLSLVVLALFTLAASFFVPLGALLGEQFRRLQALQAYSLDIAGSLTGILVFGVASALRLPPLVWFAVGFAVWIVLSLDDRRFALALVATGAFSLAIVASMSGGRKEYWSPYYRVGVVAAGPAVQLEVNGSLHQVILDLDSTRAQRFPYARVARAGYVLPYDWGIAPETALVVGSGTGNDLALLLARGARYVDAVEIDPVIADVGRALHRQQPYSDPRVHLHIDDARAFLRKTTRRYDLIVFGTLDSQTLLSGMSSVRLDNYVYTEEAFGAARDRLKAEGSLVVYHRSPEAYIGAKIYQMIAAAFDAPPGVYNGEMNLFNLIFVAGHGAAFVPPAAPPVLAALRTPYAGAVDDWPYLYLRGHTVPGHYRLALITVLAVTAAFVLFAAGSAARRGSDAPMFFLGAGFLLVETKSITEMSLLFGSTWTVNLFVFASILGMVLLANVIVRGRPPIPTGRLFPGLLLSLAIAYVVPANSLLWMGTAGQWAVGSLMVALPIFFAALIFSSLFRQSSDPPRAFAYNLLGAIIGGVLEYSSMAVGIKALYLIAGGVYLLAWLAERRTGSLSVSCVPG